MDIIFYKIPMNLQQKRTAIDFRKRITNQFHLRQLELLEMQYGLNPYELCWKFITERIVREKEKREEIEEIKKRR